MAVANDASILKRVSGAVAFCFNRQGDLGSMLSQVEKSILRGCVCALREGHA